MRKILTLLIMAFVVIFATALNAEDAVEEVEEFAFGDFLDYAWKALGGFAFGLTTLAAWKARKFVAKLTDSEFLSAIIIKVVERFAKLTDRQKDNINASVGVLSSLPFIKKRIDKVEAHLQDRIDEAEDKAMDWLLKIKSGIYEGEELEKAKERYDYWREKSAKLKAEHEDDGS